jgi:hypothetical protein
MGVCGRAPSSSRFKKIASLQFFPAKHPNFENYRSTKSMGYLKGYSTKVDFVLTRGVGWKVPTFAIHYTTYQFVFFPYTSRRMAPLLFLLLAAHGRAVGVLDHDLD